MPTHFIEFLAKKKKYGTKKELEDKWEKAKSIAKEQGHKDEYDYIMGIFKRMIGYKNPRNEALEFDDHIDDLLHEARIIIKKASKDFDEREVPPRGRRLYQIYVGRFQPLHIGHYNIIKKMNNPVVAIIRGKKSSQDPKKNPFSVETQLWLFNLVFGGSVRVLVSQTAYLPDVFAKLRKEENMEPVVLWCGEDRVDGYRRQIERINEMLRMKEAGYKQYFVKIKLGERATSATKIRKLIAENKYDEYSKLVPPPMRDEKVFNLLREELLRARGEK